MSNSLRESLANRENQWRVFHRWKSEQKVEPISLQARVSWYNSAFEISSPRRPRTPEEIEDKVRQIQRVRAGLAHLK